MMSELIYFVCFLIGAVISWIVCKAFVSKSMVDPSAYKAVQDQLAIIQTQKAVADETISNLKADKYQLQQSNDLKQNQLEQLSTQLAERATQKQNLEEALQSAKDNLNALRKNLDEKDYQLNDLLRSEYSLKAELSYFKDKLATQKLEIEGLGQKFETAFKVLAQNILEDKTKKFSEEQEKNLKVILEPLEKEIKLFKQDIEVKHKQESDERLTLREQVKNMTTLNQTLSDQANKLTETLRLQVKQQGDWGESILEAILENSGLQKGLQYFTQQSSKNDYGKTIRPDVLVKYPDQRTIIIDSKVSLVHYYNMCGAGAEDEQRGHLKQLITSIKNHIDDLSSKNYKDISEALDFIIMFVPVEPAYIAAMHSDPALWQYAYKKGILLISPANLIATLKLVKDMWRKDAVDRNAQEIADKAGKLYDKLACFVESFEKLGNQLDKASETWDDAKKQLVSGKNNLISQAVKMKGLHINAKKDLPEDLAAQALSSDSLSREEVHSSELPLFE